MAKKARILSGGSKDASPLRWDGVMAMASLTQNKPNSLRFQAINADRLEKQSQTTPILSEPTGPKSEGSQCPKRAKQSQFSAWMKAGSSLMRRGDFRIMRGLYKYYDMLGCFRSMEALRATKWAHCRT